MERSSSEYAWSAASRQSGHGSGVFRRAAAAVLQHAFPPRSLVSGEEVAGPGALAPHEFAALRFLTPPWCVRCGLPFEAPQQADQTCAACLASPPDYVRARAALAYGDGTREMVLALKHAGRRDGLAQFGRWMAAACGELLAGADLVAPVPLHYGRLVRRGFNQSGWLAAALARESGRKLCVDLLVRSRATPSQAGLSAAGRRRNVEGAFRVRRKGLVAGRRVLLVDDVFTTGATVEACARVLTRAGASGVDVATLARVVAPRDATI